MLKRLRTTSIQSTKFAEGADVIIHLLDKEDAELLSKLPALVELRTVPQRSETWRQHQ